MDSLTHPGKVMLVVAAVMAAHKVTAVTPIDCAQMADGIYALVKNANAGGGPIPVPRSFEPYVKKANEFYMASDKNDPYFHSTTFLLECIRTNGDVNKMYDKKYMVDPEGDLGGQKKPTGKVTDL
jgi:hypothetical protein